MSEALPDLKAARAAMAIVQSPFDPYQQIVDLYPEAKDMDREGRRKLRIESTQSERVKAIMQDDVFKLDEHRDAILTHMVDVALNRAEPEQAIRAATLLAKIGGWAAPARVEVSTKALNIHQIFKDADAVSEALALMSHEPGAATAIPSDARADHEKRRAAAPFAGSDSDDE